MHQSLFKQIIDVTHIHLDPKIWWGLVINMWIWERVVAQSSSTI